MDILDLLTRSGTYVLAVTVVVITFITRRVVETVWPSLKKQADANAPAVTYLTMTSRWWNEVILYVIPVLVGGMASFVQSDFLFAGIDGGARWMYGAGVGWFSSFLYKGLKKAALGRLNLPDAAVASRPSIP
jgi:hypothetical protein